MDSNNKKLSLDSFFEGEVIDKKIGNNFVHIKVESDDNFLHPIDIQTRNPIYVNNTIKPGTHILYCIEGIYAKSGEQYIKVCPD